MARKERLTGRGGSMLRGLRRRIDERRLREFRETGQRLARERAAAGHQVTELIESTPPDDWPTLAERGAFQTCGALETLGRMVSEAIGAGHPQRATAIAAVAVSSAEAIPDVAYPQPVPAQIRAHAWNDYARALRSAGRVDESLRATGEAYARLEGIGSLAHDRAIVALAHAETLERAGRSGDAAAVLAAAERTFLEHGDDRRATMAAQRRAGGTSP